MRFRKLIIILLIIAGIGYMASTNFEGKGFYIFIIIFVLTILAIILRLAYEHNLTGGYQDDEHRY